jgi:hypothetical protein
MEGQGRKHLALGEQCRVAVAELESDDEQHRMKYRSTQLMLIFAACHYRTLAVYGSEPRAVELGGLRG